LAAEGLVIGSAGNVSVREGECVAITPTGAQFDQIEPEHVSVLDLEGRQVAGELAPTSELELHLGVYRRYGSGAVIHTHPPIGTALACVLEELPVIHYGMLVLGGPVRVAPYATFGSSKLAQVTLDALRERAAALMANHGAIVHGGDLDAAMSMSLLLEWACTVYWRAAAIGHPRSLSGPELADVAEAALARGYGSPRRIAE
jgi:L-fuculose-phosphate aldolase